MPADTTESGHDNSDMMMMMIGNLNMVHCGGNSF